VVDEWVSEYRRVFIDGLQSRMLLRHPSSAAGSGTRSDPPGFGTCPRRLIPQETRLACGSRNRPRSPILSFACHPAMPIDAMRLCIARSVRSPRRYP
jgi:hypothetical protein